MIETDNQVLDYFLKNINILYKKSIEFGGNGIKCITSNLIFENNFHGLYFDLDERNIQLGIEYYKAHNKLDLITFVNGLITIDNISEIIKSLIKYNNNYIDVLVINIKDNGYWLLKELIKYIHPRIIIVEFQPIIPNEFALIAPYDEKNNHKDFGDSHYYGASIKAYKLLLTDYIYVYYNNSKAYFINKLDYNDKIYTKEYVYNKKLYNKFKIIKDLPWIKI